jgi:diadenosine tetraphosphate (Ap4A) HIT family hydrolase
VTYRRVPFDIATYAAQVQSRPCFICEIVNGERDDHLVVFRDDICMAFLARTPITMVGYTLVVPLEHRVDVVSGFTEEEYVALQRRVHRIGRAVEEVTGAARLYVCSLGSHEANAHVHWHLAPLPPGVPYEQQQFFALMTETAGTLEIPESDMRGLAEAIRAAIDR